MGSVMERLGRGALWFAGLLYLTKPLWTMSCHMNTGTPVCSTVAGVDLAAALLVLFALAGIHAAPENPGMLATVSAAFTVAGAALVVGVKWMRLFVQPVLLPLLAPSGSTAHGVPAPIVLGFSVAFLSFAAGLLLTAVVFARSRACPRWVAALLALSAVSDLMFGGLSIAEPMLGVVLLALAMQARVAGRRLEAQTALQA